MGDDRAAFRSLLATLPSDEERERLLGLLPENDQDVREWLRGQASPDETTPAVWGACRTRRQHASSRSSSSSQRT
jgi:succinate dehydrogenase flavin-adding protein (antitoxin of CptAB toxin-antitoxin module)